MEFEVGRFLFVFVFVDVDEGGGGGFFLLDEYEFCGDVGYGIFVFEGFFD